MKIYSMTATFGKLVNRTLTLDDGLNVICAPNEWGKSTWCAFLVNMLYGLETRAKTTKATLADKERYAPWSGEPMSGKIELCWDGRDITIERRTKGRTPMGEFRAYETHSGLPVPELTAQTCGEQLLGVERSVFLRSAFLRLSDLPVTYDESLRRRLNALVTTGDESDAGDVLAKKLKDLKNKVYLNRSTGLIPNAQAEAAVLAEKLRKIDDLNEKTAQNQQAQREVAARIEALENHKATLEYEAAADNARRITLAEQRAEQARAQATELARNCAALPDENVCRAKVERLQALSECETSLNTEIAALPPAPEKPSEPITVSAEQATDDARQAARLRKTCKSMRRLLVATLAVMGLAALLLVLTLGKTALTVAFAVAAAAGAVGGVASLLAKRRAERALAELAAKYGTSDMQTWEDDARRVSAAWEAYHARQMQWQERLDAHNSRRERLNAEICEVTGGEAVAPCLRQWQENLRAWEALATAKKRADEETAHAETVSAMAKDVPKPQKADDLTYSAQQTQTLLAENLRRQQELNRLEGEYRGNITALGQRESLQQQLAALRTRIDALDKTYQALDLALNTLTAARAELQRRFAPQITQQAQRILAALTDGRYDRLSISEDLSLEASTQSETVPYGVQWRSEGTIDQMYLALRLAVSNALMPSALMILDDALVRFDDVRHAAAMALLRQEAEHRQILFFTCQSRADTQ